MDDACSRPSAAAGCAPTSAAPRRTHGERYVWEQEIEGTPFERVLRSARLEIGLRPQAGGTEVTLTTDEALRGLSRLGAPMMRGAARRRLDEALGGIERALVGA